ncbi:hypothetical protein E2C01_081025 [Portunus trituberculatus]|uniref:Uncharacterized protein n=1 Tax=Portunus trituberculatus TaxID=210409 RepID=A0A5B7IXL2_PORTR|nr:hypothetical protein [Portunus trituberculatus]
MARVGSEGCGVTGEGGASREVFSNGPVSHVRASLSQDKHFDFAFGISGRKARLTTIKNH